MTELELIVDLHQNTNRQGPGSELDTLQALSFIPLGPDTPLQIADIGSGNGGQTLTLALELSGTITAIDMFPQFLEVLQKRAASENLLASIQCKTGKMEQLPFGNNALDILWSEGAIYSMGFSNGIAQWKPFLKLGGYLAVSEITWITNTRPASIENYWQQHYSEIDTAANKIKQLENCGYSLSGYFHLPPESWIDEYYIPLEHSFDAFLERNQAHSSLAKNIVQEYKDEIAMYHKYKDYFSYGFYIAKKTED